MHEILARRILHSPVGLIAVGATSSAVTQVTFLAHEHHLTDFTDGESAGLVAEQAAMELEEYFVGKRISFDSPVDLVGTEFQRRVWREIAAVPFGKTLTYGDIASAIGKPKASRAVGGAVGANPVPIIIGCHRVMGSTGKLTGYSGGEGIETKIRLLELEGINYR